MKRREAVLALGTAAVLVVALLTVFAIELSGSLSKSRTDIEKSFHQRAQLTAALTSSIFNSTSGTSQRQDALQFGGSGPALTSAATRAARTNRSAFVVVLDGRGALLAASPGLTPAARAQLSSRPPAVGAALAGSPVFLSDVLPIGAGGGGVIEYAQSFPLGPWIIFIAFALVALAALFLARRALRSAEAVTAANERLAHVNYQLASTNSMLERRAAELARSNAELEQFASIASHDLQEPLRKVRTFTQQLTATESEQLSDRGQDYLRRANLAAERMQQLIEDLLKFSRVATHGRPFAPVDLAQIAHEVGDDLEAQVAQSGAMIRIGSLPTVKGDASQMRQLFQNLVSNAIRFRRPGVAPEVRIDGRVVGDHAEITVADNGIGFDPRYSDRIFRVFERLHGRSEYPGTGIGLALCRKIAERHGGTVTAESVEGEGEGARFIVKLPVNQPEEVITSGGDIARDPEETSVHA